MIHFLGITANKCLTTFIIRYHNIIPENPLTWIRTSYSFSMQDWDWRTRLQFNLCRVRRWRKSRLKKIQKLNLIHRSNYKSTFSTFIFQKLANKFKWAGAGSIETGRAAPCALHWVFPSGERGCSWPYSTRYTWTAEGIHLCFVTVLWGWLVLCFYGLL